MEKETKEEKTKKHQKLLYFLLGIIVILVVITGSCLYYVCVKNAQLKTELDLLKNKEKISKEIDIEKNNTSSQNQVENNYAENENDLITIYRGIEIKNPGVYTYTNGMSKEELQEKEKYLTTYFCYENGEFTEKRVTELEEGPYENMCYIELGGADIAFSKKYEVVPRKTKKLEELPNELMDMADYSKVEILQVDLDGDNNNEYVACCQVEYKEGEIGDGAPEANTTVFLFDSNFKKVATLLEYDGLLKNENNPFERNFYISTDDIKCIDIDDDNIMEILIDIPLYEGAEVSVIKYENGKVNGEINHKGSINP